MTFLWIYAILSISLKVLKNSKKGKKLKNGVFEDFGSKMPKRAKKGVFGGFGGSPKKG